MTPEQIAAARALVDAATPLIKRLENPPFGTETSERNLMARAAAELTAQTARANAAEARAADLTAKLEKALRQRDDYHKAALRHRDEVQRLLLEHDALKAGGA